ncbi:hypothetical protein AB1Y20_022422 [Prymnesium parvum]|uniref:PITH domain-containing protein n=1 Tax=Prymnesium parvum TaxID=97485 RepID=A0AB34JJG6_PRYPA
MKKMTAAAEAAPPPAPPAAYGAASMVDLEDSIVWNACECLNRTSKSSVANILKQGLRDQEELLLESDADEQLLISVTFRAQVRLHSLLLSGPADGRAPKTVKLFANRDNLDFDGAEEATADHEFVFEDMSLMGERLELGRGFVKFQRLQTLVIFVQSNQGGMDSTAISTLKLWGASDQGTNMKDFKRVAGEAGEGE